MSKKLLVVLLIGSLGANFFSLYILDKALFYRKHLSHIENTFPNRGARLAEVQDLTGPLPEKTGVFIGGSLVKFWFLPQDLPVLISNQGGLEEKISVDYQKMKSEITGSGADYVFINSGFCEIHTAVNAEKDVDAVIDRNFEYLKKIVRSAQNDGIMPVLTTLTPVRKAFVFPYTKFLSIPSKKKQTENKAIKKYNRMIRQYAEQKSLPLIDFEKACSNEDGRLKKKYSVTDGEHLDLAGYQRLNRLLKERVSALADGREL